MFPRALLSVAWLNIVAGATAAIDLTPTPSAYVAEGIAIAQLTFADGKQRITYEPPPQWTYRGSRDRLHLVPPSGAAPAEAVIQVLPLPAPQPPQEQITTLQQAVLRDAPPGAQAFTVLAVEQNAPALGGNPSISFVVSYAALGRTFHRHVIFVHCAEEQLMLRLSADKENFAALDAAFRRSIISWRWNNPNAK